MGEFQDRWVEVGVVTQPWWVWPSVYYIQSKWTVKHVTVKLNVKISYFRFKVNSLTLGKWKSQILRRILQFFGWIQWDCRPSWFKHDPQVFPSALLLGPAVMFFIFSWIFTTSQEVEPHVSKVRLISVQMIKSLGQTGKDLQLNNILHILGLFRIIMSPSTPPLWHIKEKKSMAWQAYHALL